MKNRYDESNKHEMKVISFFFPKINFQQKISFITAFVTMLLTHLYMFTNEIVNHDDVNRLLIGDTDEAKIQHGRWAAVIFDRISGSTVGIPYIIGLISTIAVAGACVVLVTILQLEKKISVMATCLLICTFPVASNIFLYTYIADVYFISMFLAIWGAWLVLESDWRKNGVGVFALTLACGCYQAFWCMGIALLFLALWKEFLKGELEWRKLIKKAIKIIALSGLSLIAYLLINRVVQSVTGFGATDYKGLSSMGAFHGVLGLAKTIVVTYYEFIQFFYVKGFFIASKSMIIINVLLTVFVLVLLIRIGKQKKRATSYWIIMLLFVCCIPMASNLISVASQNATHILMQYGFVVPYLLCIMLMEYPCFSSDERQRSRLTSSIVAFAYLLLVAVAYKGYITDNEVYFRQQLNYEATYSYTLRLLYRIEAFEGYTPDMQVAFINEEPQINDHVTIMMENYPEEMNYFSFLNEMVGTEPRTFVKRANDIADFCKYFHGYDLQLVDLAELPELAQTDEFRQMETYPKAGGMRIIDDVLVIKLPDKIEQ